MEKSFVETSRGRWEQAASRPSQEQIDRFDEAMTLARQVRQNAHAPYSRFQVGAAVLMNGEWFAGCNVENASYGATICAERNAIAAGVAAGKKTIELIAITTGADPGVPMGNRSPCGMCRQVISEFSGEGTIVLLDGGMSDDFEFTGEAISFEQLLPWQFELE